MGLRGPAFGGPGDDGFVVGSVRWSGGNRFTASSVVTPLTPRTVTPGRCEAAISGAHGEVQRAGEIVWVLEVPPSAGPGMTVQRVNRSGEGRSAHGATSRRHSLPICVLSPT